MNDGIISVVIPVFNHAAALKKSLESLNNQSFKNFEIIIVNDGSTDNLEEVVEIIKKDPKFKGLKIKLVSQSNLGAAAARNRGLDEVMSEFVIFWDADTVGAKEMLKTMFEALKNNPDAAYSYSDYQFGLKKMKAKEFNADSLKQNNYIDTTSLIRTSEMGKFDINLNRFQDWDLWLTMLQKNKKGIYIPEMLFKKIVGKRKGISIWLPSFFYKFKFLDLVKKYYAARAIVLAKHKLPPR